MRISAGALGAVGVLGVFTIVSTAKIVPKLMGDRFLAGNVGGLDDAEPEERIIILSRGREHVAQPGARGICALENQAREVGAGLIAQRVNLIHLAIGRRPESHERIFLPRIDGGRELVTG